MRQVMAAMGPIELEHRIMELERRVADLAPEVRAMRQTLDAMLAMALSDAPERISA